MLAQLHRNKRSAALASVLFVALLVYTWHSLNLESLLPAPLLHGGSHKQVPFVAARMHEVTCPGPIGEQLPSKRIPVVRGRNVSSTTHGETLSVPRVVVLIFYGRRSTVSILDCYLKVRRTNERQNSNAGGHSDAQCCIWPAASGRGAIKARQAMLGWFS